MKTVLRRFVPAALGVCVLLAVTHIAAPGVAVVVVNEVVAATSAPVPAPLLELSPCSRPEPVPSTETGASGTGGPTVVTVTVNAGTVVRLDDAGRLAAGFTNTGCAPHEGDPVSVMTAPGVFEPASPSIVAELFADRAFHGDWTIPGNWVALA